MKYLLDTNIFLSFARNQIFRKYFERIYNSNKEKLLTSVVVKGELEAFMMKRNWGFSKKSTVNLFLNKTAIYPIKTNKIIEKYAEIDAYSQGKHPTIPSNTSARNMGKNDLWVAATASVLEATLLTMDKDFDHLNEVFLDVIYIDLNKIS